MSRWLLVLLFFCVTCRSKPSTGGERAPSKVSAKVTNSPAALPPQVYVQVELSPRRPSELELGILKDERVKACFIAHFTAAKPAVIVSLLGKLEYQGVISSLTVEGGDEEMNACLVTALAKLRLGRGKVGSFKMWIATADDQIKGAKGVLIMPPEMKKFE